MTTTEAVSVSERTMMWGRIGTIFAKAPVTAEEAIKKGGLDWDVELRPLGFKSASGKNFVKAPGRFATVRSDTEAPLGVVKSRYKVVNNREAFQFADELVDGAGAAFESAWSLDDGRTVGLTMRLPSTVTVGGEDPFNSYLMLRTSHDGTGSVHLAVQNVRMACLNQFNLNLRNAQRSWRIPHSERTGSRLQAAREALEIAFAYDEVFEAEMEKLMAKAVTPKAAKPRVAAILKSHHVSDVHAPVMADAILANWETSSTIGDDQRGTAYGLLNATTEYFDHVRTYRTDLSAWKVSTEGLGARTAQSLVGAFS